MEVRVFGLVEVDFAELCVSVSVMFKTTAEDSDMLKLLAHRH
jgi:hypothetical protein